MADTYHIYTDIVSMLHRKMTAAVKVDLLAAVTTADDVWLAKLCPAGMVAFAAELAAVEVAFATTSAALDVAFKPASTALDAVLAAASAALDVALDTLLLTVEAVSDSSAPKSR